MPDLERLLKPRSLAVIGGGAWCRSVIGGARSLGYDGTLWPVHPTATEMGGYSVYSSLKALPEAPDLAFVGVNRTLTVGMVETLSAMGAGGAVCFASGFAEAEAEDGSAKDLAGALAEAAGEMPILGPNTYGFLNALDGVAVWPDQHGLEPVEQGVAILGQSSNIALNLTMQRSGLPITHVITVGNQMRLTQADLARRLVQDPRVTAIGLHVEGFSDLRAWEALAATAAEEGVPLVVLKSGRSAAARAAAVSHTASLAGSDAGAQAFLDRLGIARVRSAAAFIQTLMLLHVAGPLAHAGIASVSSSGGEAALIADMAEGSPVSFPALNDRQKTGLRAALGPKVALANPLDYHTYIWRDTDAIARTWSALSDPDHALTMAILDLPRDDRCDPADWDCAIEAVLRARTATGRPFAVVSSLPGLLPEATAKRLIAGGVAPLSGLTEALEAVEAAANAQPRPATPVWTTAGEGGTTLLTEAAAKAALTQHDLRVPAARTVTSPSEAGEAAGAIGGPVALKAVGLAHKSDAGGVHLGLTSRDAVEAAFRALPTETALVEEMVPSPIAELLIGVVRDPAHGFVLTLGAGGVLTELLADSASLLLPVEASDIEAALSTLKVAKLLAGYRGKPAADMRAIVDAVLAVQSYVAENADAVEEVEINPLMAGPDTAIAVDALIRLRD
ncbi:MAG: acetate--CoA ligase family protein [Pseudomonadota bacterium]